MEIIIQKTKVVEKQKEIEIKNIAKQKVKDIGIKIQLLGFKYWVTATTIAVLSDFESDDNLKMMDVYSIVAKKHKTTPSKVEKALRYAYADIDLNMYFNVSYHINNTALLFLLKDAVITSYYNETS